MAVCLLSAIIFVINTLYNIKGRCEKINVNIVYLQ